MVVDVLDPVLTVPQRSEEHENRFDMLTWLPNVLVQNVTKHLVDSTEK